MKTHEQIFRAASAKRSESQPGIRHRLFYLSLLLLAFSTNCDVLQGAVPILDQLFPSKSGRMDKQAELLVEVQDSLLRFADEYSMRMVDGVDSLRRGTDALSPAEVLRLKIAIGSETWSIASGPNAVADLIDMTVFVTVMRMTLEDYWQPKVFGKSALPMLAYSRSAEADIWKLAGKVLKLEQQTDLRQSIAAWHQKNPLRESLVALRSLDFASRVTAVGQDADVRHANVAAVADGTFERQCGGNARSAAVDLKLDAALRLRGALRLRCRTVAEAAQHRARGDC
jgi:hypothetical protein